MKAHEILTVMATKIVKPGRWKRNSNGAPYQLRHCLVGKREHVLDQLGLRMTEAGDGLSNEVSVALSRAVFARRGLLLEDIPFDFYLEGWNDDQAENARDVADLCHEAALIAKERE